MCFLELYNEEPDKEVIPLEVTLAWHFFTKRINLYLILTNLISTMHGVILERIYEIHIISLQY